MSAELLAHNRPLRQEEVDLIIGVVRGTPVENKIVSDISGAIVQDMDDGGMGSIKFIVDGLRERRFGRQIYHGAFSDSDGVSVSVTINLDQNGDLFELDFFKADNSPLIRYPSVNDMNVVQSC